MNAALSCQVQLSVYTCSSYALWQFIACIVVLMSRPFGVIVLVDTVFIGPVQNGKEF